MALEIWKPPATTSWANPAPQKPPEGEGWQITGYNTIRNPANPNRMGSGFTTTQTPIYGRSAPAPAPPPPPPAAPQLSISDLYQKVLGRAPDAGGAAYWQNAFGSEIDAAEAAAFGIAAQRELNERNKPPTPAPTEPAPVASAPSAPPPPGVDIGGLLMEMQIASQRQMDALMQGITGRMSAQQKAFDEQRLADAAARDAQLKQMAETQRTYAINQSRSSAAKNLQIEGASSGGGIGGTAPFKIRKQGSSLQGPSPIKLASTLNI